MAAHEPQQVICRRVDGDNANAEYAWRALGSPAYVDPAHVERLQEASRVRAEAVTCEYKHPACHFNITMPPTPSPP